MATDDDVRELALALPGARDVTFYAVGGLPFAEPYVERDRTRRRFTGHPGVWAIRCPMAEKEMLIEASPHIYFDDDYYRRYPVVLVRLANIEKAELAAMLARSHAIQAAKVPKR